MSKKIRQITDSIHGTIYLSELEAELISTPYFYRLHDIYQSSTAYMTFPTNRTKRYEHSLGTMELASSMLFSAISNADNDIKKKFFKELEKSFMSVSKKVLSQAARIKAYYFISCKPCLDDIFLNKTVGQKAENIIKDIITHDLEKFLRTGIFSDPALDNFQFYPMEYSVGDGDDVKYYFLYRCLLQALRIVALFHDVGHPPYSHIIETVLSELYEDTENWQVKKWNQNKANTLREILEPYATKDSTQAFICDTILSQMPSVDAQLHERIGLSILQSAMNDVIPEMINRCKEGREKPSAKITKALYYIMVMEFTLAISVENGEIFRSMHKIVDGILDADRFDYIMRDSLNSSVNWGAIPYKRLINSSKMVCPKKEEMSFVIAYPSNVADDIIDMLMIRYKIFIRINYHHRCVKTTVALQAAVKELSEDYLKADEDNKCLEENISILWTALSQQIGERGVRLIQWNDSWLISVLYHALVRLKTEEYGSYETLKGNLEEILLTKKRYYSLIKRGGDSKRFVKLVLEKAGLTLEEIKEKKQMAEKAYWKIELDADQDTTESAVKKEYEQKRIKQYDYYSKLYETGDMKMLNEMLSSSGAENMPLPLLMSKAMDGLCERKIVADYKVIVNKYRGKTGLPSHKDTYDEIYMYTGNEIGKLDEDRVLRPQIETIEKDAPWIFVYYVPSKMEESMDGLEEELFSTIVDSVSKAVRDVYDAMPPISGVAL